MRHCRGGGSEKLWAGLGIALFAYDFALPPPPCSHRSGYAPRPGSPAAALQPIALAVCVYRGESRSGMGPPRRSGSGKAGVRTVLRSVCPRFPVHYSPLSPLHCPLSYSIAA